MSLISSDSWMKCYIKNEHKKWAFECKNNERKITTLITFFEYLLQKRVEKELSISIYAMYHKNLVKFYNP